MITRDLLSPGFTPFVDKKLKNLQSGWIANRNQNTTLEEFIPEADAWFKNTQNNTITGWENFGCVDFTYGNAHFIECTAGKAQWNIQVLPWEYATYKLMGIQQTEPGDLEPEVPLMITLPNWNFGGHRPEWQQVLQECEEKNIDIHIDFAWLITAKNIQVDLSHHCIKSFAMSFSKYNMRWNRAGLRWSKQRDMDGITIENYYYKNSNTAKISAAMYLIQSVPNDYLWNNYTQINRDVCEQLDLTPTDIFHVAVDNRNGQKVGIGVAMSELAR